MVVTVWGTDTISQALPVASDSTVAAGWAVLVYPDDNDDTVKRDDYDRGEHVTQPKQIVTRSADKELYCGDHDFDWDRLRELRDICDLPDATDEDRDLLARMEELAVKESRCKHRRGALTWRNQTGAGNIFQRF